MYQLLNEISQLEIQFQIQIESRQNRMSRLKAAKKFYFYIFATIQEQRDDDG